MAAPPPPLLLAAGKWPCGQGCGLPTVGPPTLDCPRPSPAQLLGQSRGVPSLGCFCAHWLGCAIPPICILNTNVPPARPSARPSLGWGCRARVWVIAPPPVFKASNYLPVAGEPQHLPPSLLIVGVRCRSIRLSPPPPHQWVRASIIWKFSVSQAASHPSLAMVGWPLSPPPARASLDSSQVGYPPCAPSAGGQLLVL